jgi:glucose/arabinose dehydrogenase
MSGTYTLNVPEGYKASVYYRGRLSKSRFMCWGPDSMLCVANMNSGEVIGLPDGNRDGTADTAIVVASDAYGHDVKYFRGALYVAEEKRVLRFTNPDANGTFTARDVFIDSILPGKKRPPGGHTTRTIVFDDKAARLYLSVGSLCNVCREGERGVIYSYDLDGKKRRIFAKGARNCVGMTLHPRTRKPWATNNGSDHQGNEIPPEWIDEIRENGFYGYPFAYGDGAFFDFHAHSDYEKLLPLTHEDSSLVKSMKRPAALVQAHVAPMAMEFANPSFTRQFARGAFVTYRGSWDRKPPAGYKIVYLHFNAKEQVTHVSDVVTGFLPEGESEPWARPVGLLADLRGNLYMTSDDKKQFVLLLSPER